MLHDSALYKSIIDIDIDTGVISSTWQHVPPANFACTPIWQFSVFQFIILYLYKNVCDFCSISWICTPWPPWLKILLTPLLIIGTIIPPPKNWHSSTGPRLFKPKGIRVARKCTDFSNNIIFFGVITPNPVRSLGSSFAHVCFRQSTVTVN